MSTSSRTELLNLLGDVKARVQDKLGAVEFPMPQFILMGKQSVGKSRLIETMAGECFNFISGTLGSRRPTVLEFRNLPSATTSRWHVRNPETMVWEQFPAQKVMELVGARHEELGADVSSDAVYVRLESANCVDMQIVDLPGFRDFALDTSKEALARKIEALVTRFMQDKNNVMLCVEQANDAATMSSLAKCRQVDPNFDRTVLIRNKLDKYYKDLTPENVSQWISGHGDLPQHLTCFSLTLPHWKDSEAPPVPFDQLTESMNQQDIDEMLSKDIPPKHMATIGFRNFSNFMEKKIEQMFVDSIGPVMDKLNEFNSEHTTELENLRSEYTDTDPHKILSTTRDCGMAFATALGDVMKGQLGLEYYTTLEDELIDFHKFHADNDAFLRVPTQEFSGVGDYIEYLRDEAGIPTFGDELNGGAQFRRLMEEVEIFLRFSEIAVETKKRDVIQARGVSMSSLTWRDVVVKLLGNEAHLPLQQRVRYVGERIKWFFVSQKEPVLEFMSKSDSQAMGGSKLPGQAARIITQNEITKHLLFEAWDKACQRQLDQFLELFDNMLTSTFSNPWVFLKAATTTPEATDCVEDLSGENLTKQRIPREIESRAGTERTLQEMLNTIPTESTKIEEAVDKVQMLVLKTYSYIRSQICDQVEIFSESFFKVPMLRQLSSDMSEIQLSEEDQERYRSRRERLNEDIEREKALTAEMQSCIDKITQFKINSQALRGTL